MSGRRVGRPRQFDWDQARRLRAEGIPVAEIAERFGVSTTSVYFATNDEQRERQYRMLSERAYWRTGACVDCGTPVSRFRPGSRCRDCNAKNMAFTVRDDCLLCTRCDRWLPDDNFPGGKASMQRRGRHSLCRPCQTETRREWRQRNPEKTKAADLRDYQRRRAAANDSRSRGIAESPHQEGGVS